jgi:O-antigen ligase
MASALDPIISYSVLIVLCVSIVPYGSVEPWWHSMVQAGGFVIAALWALKRRLIGKGPSPLILQIATPAFLICAFAMLQTLPLIPTSNAGPPVATLKSISADPFETQNFALSLLSLTFLGLAASDAVHGRRRFRLLVHAVIVVGVMSALFALARFSLQGDADGFLLPRLATGVGFGQFINQNHFALMMEMTFGLVLGLILLGGIRSERVAIYAACGLLLFIALVLCNSRGGLLSITATIVFITLIRINCGATQTKLTSGRIASLFLLSAGLIVFITFAVVWIGGAQVANRLTTIEKEVRFIPEDGREGVRRIDIWRASVGLIRSHALLGSGFGAYGVAITPFHVGSGDRRLEQAHNEYLEVLAAGGVVGLGLLVWFLTSVLLAIRVRFRSSTGFRRAACGGALGSMFAVSFHSMFDFGLHIPSNAILFTLLVVIATVDITRMPEMEEFGLRLQSGQSVLESEARTAVTFN